jgi:hypothetical protein
MPMPMSMQRQLVHDAVLEVGGPHVRVGVEGDVVSDHPLFLRAAGLVGAPPCLAEGEQLRLQAPLAAVGWLVDHKVHWALRLVQVRAG